MRGAGADAIRARCADNTVGRSKRSALRRLPRRNALASLAYCALHFRIQLSNSQRSATGFGGAPGAPLSISTPQKTRGAERRQALVRNAAPGGPPRGRADLRIA